MAVGVYNIETPHNADFELRARLEINGIPMDVTDFLGRMQVKQSKGHPKAIIDLTVENGGVIFEVDSSRVRLYYPAVEMLKLRAPFSGYYDFVYVTPEGSQVKLLEGTFIIKEGVTLTIPE